MMRKAKSLQLRQNLEAALSSPKPDYSFKWL